MPRGRAGLGRIPTGLLVLLAALATVVAVGHPRTALASNSITVNTLADEWSAGDGLCSLREAISNFNDIGTTNTPNPDCATAVGDTTINFSVTGTIKPLRYTWPYSPFEISSTSPSATLTIDGGLSNSNFGITIDMRGDCVSGNDPDCPNFYDPTTAHRQFEVDSGASLSLADLNLVDGFGGNNGGDGGGGAIQDYGGSVTLRNVYLNSNEAGGIVLATVGNGGAIEVTGPNANLDAMNVTFDGNSAQEGGAVSVQDGTATLVNSTFNYNHAYNTGTGDKAAAIWVSGASAARIDYSTFSSNGNNFGISRPQDIGSSGGATVTIEDSILGDASPECWSDSGGIFADWGYNVENGNACGFANDGTSLINTDPQFASLAPASNLGENKTLALSWSSPAIDLIPSGSHGCNTGQPSDLTFDERGFDRPWSPPTATGQGFPKCDAGAYEGLLLSQTITFAQPPLEETYGSTFSVSPTSTSGLAVSLSASGGCTNKGFTVTMTSGTVDCSLTASQAGNLYYAPAQNVIRTVGTQTAELDVTAQNKSTTYGTTPTFTVSYSGFQLKDNASSLGGTLTFTFTGIAPTSYGPSQTPPTEVGSYYIMPSGYTSDNYNFVYAPGTYTIGVASQSITVNTAAPDNAVYQSTFTVAATASSGLPVVYSSSGVCSNDGPVFTMNYGSGNCFVYFDQSGNSDYSPAPQISETVQATRLSQSITVGTPAPSTAAYNSTFTVAATASSGLGVTYSSSGACINNGPQFQMTSGTGTCDVMFDQAGDGNYLNAPEITEIVTATQLSQTVVFTSTAPTAAVYGDTYAPTATGGASGNAVVFGASGACALSGSSVVMTSSGTCTVTADQDGNADYAAAPQAQQSFTVGKRPASIAFTGTPIWSTGSATVASTTVTLTGMVTPAAGGTVDLTNAGVTFLLYRSSDLTMTTPDATCAASVDSTGLVTCSLGLGVGTWTVVMVVPASNGCFKTGSDTEPAVVTVYAPEAGHWAAAAGSIPDGGGAGNFGFLVTKSKGSPSIYVFRSANGQDDVVNCTFDAPDIKATGSVSFNAYCRLIVIDPTTGQALQLPGGTGYTAKVNALDGAPDRYAITIYTPRGLVFHQVGWKKSEVALSGGDVIVHS